MDPEKQKKMTLYSNSAATLTVCALSLTWTLYKPEEEEWTALEIQWPQQHSYMERNKLFYNISIIGFFLSFLVESKA